MVMRQEESFRRVRQVLVAVLLLNWAVAAAKIILGLWTRSASILADGFHSFSDGSSNIVGIVGIAMASRPRDTDHPYGHGKMENVAAIGIAMMLLLVAFELFQEALRRLRQPVAVELNALSFAVMAGTMLVNFLVTRYEYRRGKELASDILVADSFHTRTDIFVSLAVILGMLGVILGLPVLDPLISLIVVVMIGRMAYRIFSHTSHVLCDRAVIDPGQIRKVILSIRRVKDCHEIRTRGREDEVMVDLHISVDPSMPVGTAHDLSEEIEAGVKKAFPGVAEVIVHVEPPGK